MTDAKAILATFSDFKVIKTRRIAQFVFEVPLAKAYDALGQLGGLPEPAAETWCGIARIDPKAASEPRKPAHERRAWDQISYAQQAGIRCNEEAFQRFIAETFCELRDRDDTAEMVRRQCLVRSRGEIKRGFPSGDHWETLERAYQSWLKEVEVVG